MTTFPPRFGQIEAEHDDVLAVGRARGERNLGRLGADHLSEAHLEVVLLVGAEVGAPGPGAAHAKRHRLLDGARGERAQRVERGGVQVGLDRRRGEIGAHGRRKDASGSRRLLQRCPRWSSRQGQRPGTCKEFASPKAHV